MKQVSKKYVLPHSCVEALHSVTFTINEGESVAIMGPSGSGKSTLLHLIGCLDTPTSGSYSLGGLDVSSLNDRERSFLRGKKIGFVFQSHNLIVNLSVFENVATPLLYQRQKISEEEIQQQVIAALKKVDLLHRINHMASELSGGESQRVAIARALVIHPWLILADEPTGSLDKENRSAILELFDHLNQSGTTLVIVTHDAEVASFCHRRVQLKDGVLYETTS